MLYVLFWNFNYYNYLFDYNIYSSLHYYYIMDAFTIMVHPVVIGAIGLLVLLAFGYYFSVKAPSKKCNIKMFSGINCKVAFEAPLSSHIRFGVGGRAEILFRPSDLSDLVQVLQRKRQDMPVTPLGMGSNVLIRDGGVPGLVVKLGKGFSSFSCDHQKDQIKVGAGLSQYKLSKLCAREGIGGLEFLCGIPGTVGGALRMNAGAHGTEVKDRLVSATIVDDCGQVRVLQMEDLDYSYRHCGVPKDWIFVSAVFQGIPRCREETEETMEVMIKYREERQPVNEKTAGCTFANWDSDRPAWKLIALAGCQGLKHGDAMVSDKHANFLINTNAATGQDLETLGNIVKERVLETSGVELRWEVERIGVK